MPASNALDMSKNKNVSFFKRVTSPWRLYQMLLWLKHAIRNRSLTFFSVVNPEIPFAGMLSDRKSDIYDIIDSRFVPNTMVYDGDLAGIAGALERYAITFPLIVKPNTGVGGNGVYKADTMAELVDFLRRTTIKDLLIQNFIHLRKEFSIMYYCLPKSNEVVVFSVVEKGYPTIVGDGKSTIEALIRNIGNERIRLGYVLDKFKAHLSEVPPAGEEIVVDYIGNFVSGAEFLPHHVNIPKDFGVTLYNALTKKGNIHFARLDVKADSVEELLEGKFEIIEVNGAKSEPLEIYSPSVESKRKREILKFHWMQMERIAREQAELGVQRESFRASLRSLRSIIRSLSES